MVKSRGSFHFSIEWATLRYLVVCLIAFLGMIIGSVVLNDYEIGMLMAFGGYIIARVLLWIFYKE